MCVWIFHFPSKRVSIIRLKSALRARKVKRYALSSMCSINKTDSLIQVGSVKEGLSNSMLSGILNSDLHLGVLLLTLCNAVEDNKEVPKSNLLS